LPSQHARPRPRSRAATTSARRLSGRASPYACPLTAGKCRPEERVVRRSRSADQPTSRCPSSGRAEPTYGMFTLSSTATHLGSTAGGHQAESRSSLTMSRHLGPTTPSKPCGHPPHCSARPISTSVLTSRSEMRVSGGQRGRFNWCPERSRHPHVPRPVVQRQSRKSAADGASDRADDRSRSGAAHHGQ